MGFELPQGTVEQSIRVEQSYKQVNPKTQKFAGNTTTHLRIGEGHQHNNKNRISNISRIFGTNTEIGFWNESVSKPKDNKTFDFDANWKSRKCIIFYNYYAIFIYELNAFFSRRKKP